MASRGTRTRTAQYAGVTKRSSGGLPVSDSVRSSVVALLTEGQLLSFACSTGHEGGEPGTYKAGAVLEHSTVKTFAIRHLRKKWHSKTLAVRRLG